MQKISTLVGIIIIVIIAVIAIGGVFAYQYYFKPINNQVLNNNTLPENNNQSNRNQNITQQSELEKNCLNSGGQISTGTANFCKDVADFPNTCLDEGYAFLYCPPEGARSIKICDCGPKKCFSGDGCVYDEYIEVIFPNGGEELIAGEDYKIQWEQNKLDKWGDTATICLVGFDNSKNKMKAKEENSLCYAFDNEETLIAKTTLSKKEYQWVVPKNITERFEESPSFYKISVAVYDSLPPEGRSEWAGFINSDGSDNYFTITSE